MAYTAEWASVKSVGDISRIDSGPEHKQCSIYTECQFRMYYSRMINESTQCGIARDPARDLMSLTRL